MLIGKHHPSIHPPIHAYPCCGGLHSISRGCWAKCRVHPEQAASHYRAIQTVLLSIILLLIIAPFGNINLFEFPPVTVPKPTDWTVLIAIVVSIGSCALLFFFIFGIMICYKHRKEKGKMFILISISITLYGKSV